MADLLNLGTAGKKPLKDQVTPFKMSLLVLVYNYCKHTAKLHQQILEDADNVYSEHEEREIMFAILQLLQSSDLELKELLQKIHGVAKPKYMDIMLSKLKELSGDGVQAIMDLFQRVPTTLFVEPSPILHKGSVLGLFVRRMVLSFEKLSFSQVIKLHQKYKTFYDSWASKQRPGSGALGGGGLGVGLGDPMDSLEGCGFSDTAMSMMDFTGDDGALHDDQLLQNASMADSGRYSQRQAEFFIAQQASMLQHNEMEALPPRQLQQKIKELLTSNPHLAEAHYLSYLNSLRVNEYCGALDSLYHYFDRQTASFNGNQGNKSKVEDDSTYRGLRYAALNMAAVQYRFGHRAESLAAVQEAIRMAQDANDHVCLQHALSWLQRLGVQGTGASAYLLDRLVAKSGELNLPYLTSLGVQAFAQHNSLAQSQPSGVFEYLLKSDIVNCQHSQSDLMSVSYAQKAALWNLYGKTEMCAMSSQLMLHLNTLSLDVYQNGEAECLAVCYLSHLHANQGDFNAAFLILDHAKSRFPVHTQHCHIWMSHEQKLIFIRAMHHGNWNGCEQALLHMGAVNSQETKYCKAQLLREKCETDQAMKLVQVAVEEGSAESVCNRPEVYCRMLLLQAELYYSTGNPTQAGQPLLACLTAAKQHHLAYIVAMATLHLAYVQMLLGMPQQALSLLEGVLITVLCHGSIYDRARAHYLWARCLVAASKGAAQPQRTRVLNQAVQLMNDVIGWFRTTEAYHRTKDAIYYQARLYHEMCYTSERNKRALEFRLLDQQYPTWNQCAVLKL